MKRSSQVALLLMGVTTAGSASYALIPPRDCAAPQQPVALSPGAVNPRTLAPGVAPAATAAPCSSSARSSGSRSSHWSSRSSSGDAKGRRGLFAAKTSGASVAASATGSGTGSRGGFGSIGRSFSFHSSGT